MNPALSLLPLAADAGGEHPIAAALSQFAGGGAAQILVGAALAVAIGGVALGAYWLRRGDPMPNYFGTKEAEGSQFEQILAELQGILLRIRSGEGRGNIPKISRLTRIFIARAGVPGAQAMPARDLLQAVERSSFSPDQTRQLTDIIEKCERVMGSDSEKIDFDLAQLAEGLRAVVYQFEGREAA